MIYPNQETTDIADSAHPWEYVWLEFDGLRVFDYRNIVRDEMLYIVENKDMPSLHLIGHLYLFLDALVNSLTSYASLRGKHLRSFYTQEAIAFIENHFHENITVESIAQACGLNRTYFGKIFKAEIGQPPQVFLNNYRMIIATNLLLATKSSVTEISKNVGYDNPLHFSRAFKKYYGISPMKWKKEHKNRYN